MNKYDELPDDDRFEDTERGYKYFDVPTADGTKAQIYIENESGEIYYADQNSTIHIPYRSIPDIPQLLGVIQLLEEVNERLFLINLADSLNCALDDAEDAVGYLNNHGGGGPFAVTKLRYKVMYVLSQSVGRSDIPLSMMVYTIIKGGRVDYRQCIRAVFQTLYEVLDTEGQVVDNLPDTREITESVDLRLLNMTKLNPDGAVVKLYIDGRQVSLKFPTYQSAEETLQILKDNPNNVAGVLANLTRTGLAKKKTLVPQHGIQFGGITSGAEGTAIQVLIRGNKYNYIMQSRQAAEAIHREGKCKPGTALNKLKEYVKKGYAECKKG